MNVDVIDALGARWESTWRAFSAAPPDFALFEDIISRYRQAQRHYHTTQHLLECFTHLDLVRPLAADAVAVELALWFHDAVYDVKGRDNEEKSAQLACQSLAQSGLSSERLSLVRDLIMATRDHQPRDQDACIVVDVDLAILAAPRERFDEYDRQIRAEYRHVPSLIYRLKRRQLLSSFLQRQYIFHTALFRGRCEAAARENLARALGT